MYCSQCGLIASDNARFCASCGSAIALRPQPIPPSAPPFTHGAPTVMPLVATAPRPWTRYWARIFDVFLFSVVVGVTVGLLAPDLLDPAFEQLLTLVALFMWTFVEAVLLVTVGTTPGKWLLKTQLARADGQALSFSDALGRSLKVWVRGMALGVPFVSLVTLISAHNRLKGEGITSWDREGSFIVRHSPVGIARIVATVAFFVLYAALLVIGSVV